MGMKAGKTTAEKLAVRNGITFYRINSDKFKTARADLFFVDDLVKERASANALIPMIIKGCGNIQCQGTQASWRSFMVPALTAA